MKRLLSVLVAAVIAFAGVRGFAQAQAADLPTVDQVLDKYITAIGGRAAIEKLTSRVSKGTVEIPDASISGTIEVSEKAPDKSLTVISLQGMVMREGADATGAWQDDPTMGVQDKKGDELASAKRESTFNSEIKMKEIYKTLAVTGKETVGGKPVYVILATPAEGTPTRFYFDTDSGLLVKLHSTHDAPQGPVDVDVLLEDYRDVTGVKMPFTVRQVTSMFTMIVHMTDIKHNVAIDDAIFKKPGYGDLRGTILPVSR